MREGLLERHSGPALVSGDVEESLSKRFANQRDLQMPRREKGFPTSRSPVGPVGKRGAPGPPVHRKAPG